MVKYPAKFTVSELKQYSIEELEELEDAMYNDRERVMTVLRYKRFKVTEEKYGPFGDEEE
tara:strand:- start:1076 stop:1255 length:180 start_codon:yes stop_codon:yes gene_type:complete